jgi:hypothetical protein
MSNFFEPITTSDSVARPPQGRSCGERSTGGTRHTIAGIVIAAGVIVLTVGLLTPVTFGWFAYQPLADATFVPGAGVFLSRITIIGWVILTIGLLAVAFLAGWRTARGRPDRFDSDSAIRPPSADTSSTTAPRP